MGAFLSSVLHPVPQTLSLAKDQVQDRTRTWWCTWPLGCTVSLHSGWLCVCVCVCVCVNLHPTDILGWDQVSLGFGGCPVSYKILAASTPLTWCQQIPQAMTFKNVSRHCQGCPLGRRVTSSWESLCVCVCVWNQVTVYSVWYLLEWLPTPVPLLGKFHGQGSLAGYSSWGHRVGHNWMTNTFTFSLFPVICTPRSL